MGIAILYLILSSAGVGIMSIIRKEYQNSNGPSFSAIAIFLTLSSFFAGIIGLCISRHIDLGINTILAAIYATISTVTAGICIFGTALGNVSTLILSATLGSLVLPSAFAIITQPETNSLSTFKIIGFICALICLTLNFFEEKEKKSSSLLFKLLCFIIFFTNGLALIIYNLEVRLCPTYPYFSFVAEFMFISAIFSLIALFFAKKGKKNTEIKKNILKSGKSYLLIIGYAIITFVSEILSIKCADIIPLIIQSPLSFGIPIIITALLDFIFYKVKLTKTNILQIIFALVCCICFVV